MCGIVGILDFRGLREEDPSAGLRSLASLKSRGPDHQAYLDSGNTWLGHTRLAVIDPGREADQPFVTADKRVELVFNGSIYNFRAIRQELERKGISFRSNSDTEVLAELIGLMGKDALARIEGDFAFAAWFPAEEKLILARDRFGTKPLYYSHRDDRMIFASSLAAMTEICGPGKVDMDILASYLRFSYVPQPGSMLKGIHQLSAGSALEFSREGVTEFRYYDIPAEFFRQEKLSPAAVNDTAGTVSELVRQAVSSRLISDKPLGVLLSGGLDSGIVAMLAAKELGRISTYSIVFPDRPAYDESKYSRLMAAHISSEHHEIEFRDADMEEAVRDFLDHIDEPFADASAISLGYLCSKASNDIAVALSGDGADELFGGYRKHRAEFWFRTHPLMIKLIRNFPFPSFQAERGSGRFTDKLRQLKRMRDAARFDAGGRYGFLASFADEAVISQLLKSYPVPGVPQALLNNLRDSEEMNDFLYTDMKWVLLNDMLVKADRMSMRHSLELRTPFLSRQLVDTVFALPSAVKVDGQGGKRILKRAFAGELPANILNRAKKGFDQPLDEWIRGFLWPMIERDLTDKSFLREQGVFDPDLLPTFVKQVIQKDTGDHMPLVWAILVFQSWWRKYEIGNG